MALMRLANSFFPNSFRGLDDKFFDDFLEQGKSLPAVNVVEDKEKFRIEVAAPGLKKEDFKLNVDNGILTISSEKRQENEIKEENYAKREFQYSSFSRSFTLPNSVDSEMISASYTDGILNIQIPKREEAKQKEPKQIQIA
jgi:HSP20 family protein